MYVCCNIIVKESDKFHSHYTPDDPSILIGIESSYISMTEDKLREFYREIRNTLDAIDHDRELANG